MQEEEGHQLAARTRVSRNSLAQRTIACAAFPSSGAAFQAVKQYAALGEFNKNSNVVIVFPDHGSRYMSKIYSDEWMQEQGFLDAENSDDSMKIEVIK